MAKEIVRKCSQCGEKVTNPDINYCLNCGNILWHPELSRRKIR